MGCVIKGGVQNGPVFSVVSGFVHLLEVNIVIYLGYSLFDKLTHFFGKLVRKRHREALLAQWKIDFCFLFN